MTVAGGVRCEREDGIDRGCNSEVSIRSFRLSCCDAGSGLGLHLGAAMVDLVRAGRGAPKPVVKGETAGRNEPCPCGSGKKYKKCHGR